MNYKKALMRTGIALAAFVSVTTYAAPVDGDDWYTPKVTKSLIKTATLCG